MERRAVDPGMPTIFARDTAAAPPPGADDGALRGGIARDPGASGELRATSSLALPGPFGRWPWLAGLLAKARIGAWIPNRALRLAWVGFVLTFPSALTVWTVCFVLRHSARHPRFAALLASLRERVRAALAILGQRDGTHFQFPLSPRGRPLRPFLTVAPPLALRPWDEPLDSPG